MPLRRFVIVGCLAAAGLTAAASCQLFVDVAPGDGASRDDGGPSDANAVTEGSADSPIDRSTADVVEAGAADANDSDACDGVLRHWSFAFSTGQVADGLQPEIVGDAAIDKTSDAVSPPYAALFIAAATNVQNIARLTLEVGDAGDTKNVRWSRIRGKLNVGQTDTSKAANLFAIRARHMTDGGRLSETILRLEPKTVGGLRPHSCIAADFPTDPGFACAVGELANTAFTPNVFESIELVVTRPSDGGADIVSYTFAGTTFASTTPAFTRADQESAVTLAFEFGAGVVAEAGVATVFALDDVEVDLCLKQ